jgi:hypothetical protein
LFEDDLGDEGFPVRVSITQHLADVGAADEDAVFETSGFLIL